MFDVDGTLVESYEFDERCYVDAVQSVLGHRIDTDWSNYSHISDAGILHQHLARHDLLERKNELQHAVKAAFIANISASLQQTAVQAVLGAADFIKFLGQQSNVTLSIATGGWGETARMKLLSAGIDITGIPLCSSNDHYSRADIMRLAAQQAGVTVEHRVTYFGDADWDKQACEQLGLNFVLVGNRSTHHQRIPDFSDITTAYRFCSVDVV